MGFVRLIELVSTPPLPAPWDPSEQLPARFIADGLFAVRRVLQLLASNVRQAHVSHHVHAEGGSDSAVRFRLRHRFEKRVQQFRIATLLRKSQHCFVANHVSVPVESLSSGGFNVARALGCNSFS